MVVVVVVVRTCRPIRVTGGMNRMMIRGGKRTNKPGRAASRGDNKHQRQNVDGKPAHARMKPIFVRSVKLQLDHRAHDQMCSVE